MLVSFNWVTDKSFKRKDIFYSVEIHYKMFKEVPLS